MANADRAHSWVFGEGNETVAPETTDGGPRDVVVGYPGDQGGESITQIVAVVAVVEHPALEGKSTGAAKASGALEVANDFESFIQPTVCVCDTNVHSACAMNCDRSTVYCDAK